MPPPEPTNPTVQYSVDAAAGYRAVIEKLRARADTSAKTFGTLATTAVTAIGIAKVGDVFPYPGDLGWWLALGAAGFASMLAAVAFMTARLWRVTQPIPARSDPELMKDYLRGDQEKQLVSDTYEENARLNGVRSLRAYEARAHRFERIADQLADQGEDASAKKLRDKAAAIRADVQAVTARAAALVVRMRTERVVMSPWTLLALILFAAGTLGFAVSADRLDSARDGEIKVAAACAEARTAKAVALPEICGIASPDTGEQVALATSRVTLATNEVALAKACAEAREANAVESKLTPACGKTAAATGPEESAPTAEDAADAAFLKLAGGWLECRAALRKADGAAPDTCTRLERAMIATLQAGGN